MSKSQNQPWLESLSDDWPSTPATPTSPNVPRPVLHSRRSSQHNSPSRIPVPARRSVEESPIDARKKVTRPCHFVRKEPPPKVQRTPITPKTPRTPLKAKSPAPEKSTASPKPRIATGRKPPPMDSRSPLRSVSNVSSQSTLQGTVQVKPQKSKARESTPEWRKRLVRGEIPSGEQCDLFAPMGLESVFKPPSPGSETAPLTGIAVATKTPILWAPPVPDDTDGPGTSRATDRAVLTEVSDARPPHPEIQIQEASGHSPPLSPTDSPGMAQASFDPVRGDERRGNDPVANDTQLRSVSGLEDLRNEGITPITLSQPDTMNGAGPSEVLKSALKHINTKLQRLSLAEGRPASSASDSGIVYQQSDNEDDGMLPEDSFWDSTSHSLPRDLSMGTQEFAMCGVHSSMSRRKYLGDGSFFKARRGPSSFPSQRLSPSTFANSRIRSSPPFYHRSHPPTDAPILPHPLPARPQTAAGDGAEVRSKAMLHPRSPLKLFGTHDTFTNNKLLRRMSQFEETFSDLSEEDEPESPSEEARRKGESRSLLSARKKTANDKVGKAHDRPASREAGGVHLHQFDLSDASPVEQRIWDEREKENNPHAYPPRHFSSAREAGQRDSHLHRNGFAGSTEFVSTKRPLSRMRQETASRPNCTRNRRVTTRSGHGGHESKRTPNTPAKDPNPKRRRTLPMSDDSSSAPEEGSPDFAGDMPLLKSSLMKQGIDCDTDDFLGRPRFASRAISPRQGHSNHPCEMMPREHLIETDGMTPESPLRGFRLPTVEITPARDEVRKGSITTQDFLNEATKIMNIIRNNGRAKSGLTSVEEFDIENEAQAASYEEDSTREEFSRPPSREDGVDLRKLRGPQDQNPRVLSHLKRFQDDDDLDFGMGVSAMSLHLDERQNPESPFKHLVNMHSTDFEAGLDNGQNGRDSAKQHDQKQTTPFSGDGDDLLEGQHLTAVTQFSSKAVSARSIATASSQSSHAKGILSSNLVSHLIPEQVNGLTYDRTKHQWVKGKMRRTVDKLKAEESEEDPFGDIPDLSVDELEELMQNQRFTSPTKPAQAGLIGDLTRSVTSPGSRAPAEPDQQSHERARQGSAESSSNQSKATRSASSGPNTGTRATSWNSTGVEKTNDVPAVDSESGNFKKPGGGAKVAQRARVVTISFSSALAREFRYNDDANIEKTGEHIRTRPATADAGVYSQPGWRGVHNLPHRRPNLGISARHALDAGNFGRRAVSRIDEIREEAADALSLVRRTVSGGATTTPSRDHLGSTWIDRQDRTAADTSYSFHLSPLADFTVNQLDESLHLELSYVAQRTHPTSLRQIHGTFALATEEMVKHIADAEPFESYWEHVRRLVMRDKRLITLHRLDDFCPRLEELDVSNNEIGQLSGVPSTVRSLRIPRNCLSNLTAWSHLTNLQYLNVSGNDLETLDGFADLVHLRELNASDNNICNIDGILDLNGLLSLKLGGNRLTSVDFEASELSRLRELDLSQNQLTEVLNVHALPALQSLDVSFNCLGEFDATRPLMELHILRLSGNSIRTFDASVCPSLRLLYVDRNSLDSVAGLDQCLHLEVFSAREQSAPDGGHRDCCFDVDLADLKDIRKVFLSANRLSPRVLSPSAPLLSLQLLDVAACTISTLPEDFGSSFPNLKVLNLNFNSISDVQPLAGMKCISRLTVVGNRLARMRKLCQTLSRLGRKTTRTSCSTLQKVDLRDNPLTQGFYPPAVTGSGKMQKCLSFKAWESRSLRRRRKFGGDHPASLPTIGQTVDILRHRDWDEEEMEEEEDEASPPSRRPRQLEVDDPYLLPPADAQTDEKYLAHLDEPTRLRRRVLELMLYAGTGGTLKMLDGLELRPALEFTAPSSGGGGKDESRSSDLALAWDRLEDLGVLKRKAIMAGP